MHSILYPFMLLLTGCGCFLIGISTMSRGFVKASEYGNSRLLSLFKSKSNAGGILGGALHSAITQSSSATSVLALRLLEIGAITTLQASRAIIGANIGTTITGFLVSLSETNFGEYIAFLVFIGSIPLLSANRKRRMYGEIIGGFGLLFVGINLLDLYIQDEYVASTIAKAFSFTDVGILLVLIGMAITMIFQSSSVSSSIIIFMVGGNLLTLTSAFYLIMGANIGACVTSILASNGGHARTKQAAAVYAIFNVIGTIIFSLLFTFCKEGIENFFNALGSSNGFKVATFHFLFNTITAIIVCPFVKPIVRLSQLFYKEKHV